MTMQYRGHDVVDPNHKLVGTINDVLYDTHGEPTWAIVDVGLLRASHYVPVSVGLHGRRRIVRRARSTSRS